ncbi:hypothetical protein [Aureimonas glaciei]|uniref:Uncharacterized protein n=1 Tax=Aureimonas glaciei TaxID=1776957 RepID=A0A916XVU9_9HYPH|nr:hypothetical protein [Aureimonas glaciei]GGD14839.1 hypothetical protein GCM10011335_16990 [Aureimonas glaciei]
MNEDRNGTQQASNKARCGRLALSMRADEAAVPTVASPGRMDALAAAVPTRPSRLSTSERLRRLEDFSAA